MAKEKKENYMTSYGFKDSSEHFHFLVADKKTIDIATDELGFRFEKIGKEYAHAGVVYFLSNKGKIVKTMNASATTKRFITSLINETKAEQLSGFFMKVNKFCGRYVKSINYRSIIGAFALLVGAILSTIFFLKNRKFS